MKYLIRFYELQPNNTEKFLKEYEFPFMPYIPQRKELIIINKTNYKVINIASSLDDYNDKEEEVWFEIIVKKSNVLSKWWE